MKIYLIGMPGSGKSTLGKQLADALMLPFVDLDKEIEKEEGQSVSEIFANKGEDYFRRLESQKLHHWANVPGEFIMATGGGAPCFFNGIEIINDTGISIFLDVAVPELIRRLEENKDRPLLQSADLNERLTSIRNKRVTIYQQAKIVIDPLATGMQQLREAIQSFKK